MVCWGFSIRVALGGAGMTNTVDWHWANERPALSIYRAVGLSLGIDLDDVRPVYWPNSDSPAADYKSRVIRVYEAARYKELQCTGTTEEPGKTFDPQAEFLDGQYWEINMVDFRQYCDAMEWAVPPEFVPRGYSPVPAVIPCSLTDEEKAAPALNAETPASAVSNNAAESFGDTPVPLTTNEIANCFAEFRGWNHARWKHELGSPKKWLETCRDRPGTRGRGGTESTWFPLKIAAALIQKDPKSANQLRARFKRMEPLKPWLELFEINHPDNSDID
jgi:hypothetical protein